MAEQEKPEESGMDPERARIYQAYAATQEAEATEQKPVEPEAEQPPVEAEVPVEGHAEAPAEKPKEEKPQEDKYVPKQALDEERAKRKRLREEKEALENRLKAYEEKLSPQAEPEIIIDYDAEINTLKNRVNNFEKLEAQRQEQAREAAAIEQRKKTDDMIREAGIDLAKEGYPGFSKMTGAVIDELQKIMADDPDAAVALDNPDGWKKIYKEIVYPDFKREFTETSKQISLEQKTALKKDANLATSSGKAPSKKEDDDPDTWDEKRRMTEYLKMRNKYSNPTRSPLG